MSGLPRASNNAHQRHQVLIVDDDPSVRAVLSIVFERSGLETRVAENGREAMAVLAREHCDFCAVILDLELPPPRGLEVARFLNQNCPELPVIIVSGHPDLAEQVRDAGLDNVKMILRKPLDSSVLIGYVRGGVECVRDAESPQP